MLQTILNKNGFGYCNFASFKNCNNCVFKLRCGNYTPRNYNNIQTNTQNLNIVTKAREQETVLENNNILQQKIQELELQILELNNIIKSKDQELEKAFQEKSINSKTTDLQIYENNNLELSQKNSTPLKAKKGLFGTKYIEESSIK